MISFDESTTTTCHDDYALTTTTTSAPTEEKCFACRGVKRQDFSPTNYTTRCSTLSTPAFITYSRLVSLRLQLVRRVAPPRPSACRQSVPDFHGRPPRGGTPPPVCPRIAQFVLFVIKIPNAARAAGGAPEEEFDRDTARAGRTSWEATGRTAHGVGLGVFSPGLRRLFITRSGDGGGNTKIFVRDYGEPAERSIWYGRARCRQRCAVMRRA